ncbi:hypothetical protein MMC17_001201 [Xylographa soralifera]|nr:hypothetical protein [Xylographa soralifera]
MFLLACLLLLTAEALNITSPVAGQVWDIAAPQVVTWIYNSTDATNVSVMFSNPGWGSLIPFEYPLEADGYAAQVIFQTATRSATFNSSWFDSVKSQMELSYFNELWTVEVSTSLIGTKPFTRADSEPFSIIDSREPAWSYPSGPPPKIQVFTVAPSPEPSGLLAMQLGIIRGICSLLCVLVVGTCCIGRRGNSRKHIGQNIRWVKQTEYVVHHEQQRGHKLAETLDSSQRTIIA